MDRVRVQRPQAEFLLLTATIFWGISFPVVKRVIGEIPVLTFLWIRFALASILLGLLAGRRTTELGWRGVGRGILLGSILFLAYLFQTFGLTRTSSTNAGFLTGLNVAWVPLLAGPLLGKPPMPTAKLGVGLSLAGLLLLTWHVPWHLGVGDSLVFVSSIFVALHVLGLDVFTRGYDGRALAFVQIATIAVLALVGSLFLEPVTWPRTWNGALVTAFAVTAVFATTYAFWAMTTFQRLTTPTRAALIYTCEPVFAAVFSVLFLHDHLNSLSWWGGALIVAGMVMVEVFPAKTSTATRT